MSATLIATLAGLVTALCWGTSDYLSAKSSKKHGAIEINFVVEIVGLGLAIVIVLFSGIHISTANQFIRIVLGNILLTSAYLIFVKALARGAVGIIVPIGNSYPLFTILLSLVFLDTRFKLSELLAMALIMAGILILAYEKNDRKIPVKELHRETLLALIAAITWGLAFFVLNPIANQVSWQTVSFVGQAASFIFASLLLGGLMIKGKKTVESVKKAFTYKPTLAIGLVGVSGTFVLYFGFHKAGSVTIPTLLSAAGPLVAAFWAALVDHEKLGLLKRVGAVVVVSGIILLNVV